MRTADASTRSNTSWSITVAAYRRGCAVSSSRGAVGMRVELDRLRPTAGGRTEAEAVLEKIEGRRLTFMVSASDTKGLVAAGKATRVAMEADRFMDTTQ